MCRDQAPSRSIRDDRTVSRCRQGTKFTRRGCLVRAGGVAQNFRYPFCSGRSHVDHHIADGQNWIESARETRHQNAVERRARVGLNNRLLERTTDADQFHGHPRGHTDGAAIDRLPGGVVFHFYGGQDE